MTTPTLSASRDGYLRERVLTATPAELTAMLFDAAVGACRAGARLAEAGDWNAAGVRLRHAQDVVLELRSSLRTDAGGEVDVLSGRLSGLYTWAWQRLVAAVTGRDAAAIEDALATLEPLRDAWRESFLKVAA